VIRPDPNEAPHGPQDGKRDGKRGARRSSVRPPRCSEHDGAHAAALHALLADSARLSTDMFRTETLGTDALRTDTLESSELRESRRVVESCAECSDEFAHLLELQQRLDDAGRSRAEVLEAARRSQLSSQLSPQHSPQHTGQHPAGAELVAPLLRARLAERRRPVRLRLVAPLIATAAAALVLVGWWMRSWFDRAETGSRGVLLGDNSSSSLKPDGPVEQYGMFEWPAVPLPPGGSYCVRVWDPIQGSPDQPLCITPGIQKTSWLVDPATAAEWPDVIEWEVQARDATNYDSGSPRFARASRLPR
jgi:hypothetical protein